jgi:dihydroflavonol-4-reductase
MSLVEKAAGRRGYGLYIPLQLAGLAAPFALAATRLLGRTPKFTPESIQVLRGHRHVSYEKAARDLGYSPRPLEETIRDTLAWFREAGITG